MSSTWQGTARSLVRRLVTERSKALAVATVVLVVLGLLGLLTDTYDLVLVSILLLQAAIAGHLVTAPAPKATAATDLRPTVEQASARTLTDLSRTRQQILDAIAEIAPRTK